MNRRYNYKDKRANVLTMNLYMLAKTLSMFEWTGLPDTIPMRELERLLQTRGYAFLTSCLDSIYAFEGGLGGEPDAYGNPTQIVIANPALNFNATLDIAKDGVLIRNDDMQLGVLPLFSHYNTLMVENVINMVMWGFNSRTTTMVSASDDRTKASVELYIKRIQDGDMSVVADQAFFDAVKVHRAEIGANVNITSMIEYHQYLKAGLYNELGLDMPYNLKRERLVVSEVEQQENSLLAFVYNMMKCRLECLEAIKTRLGLTLGVDWGSVWNLQNKRAVDGVDDSASLEGVLPETALGGLDVEGSGTADETSANVDVEVAEIEQENVNDTEHSTDEDTSDDVEVQAIDEVDQGADVVDETVPSDDTNNSESDEPVEEIDKEPQRDASTVSPEELQPEEDKEDEQ